MLEPQIRSLLMDALRPPTGYEIESAVATTFTLDLTAALVPPLAFTSFGLEDSTSDPVLALESIRRASDKITIFCQAGYIGVPAKAPDLVTFLEPMVYTVQPPRGGLFHPKVWVLKFAGADGPPAFRVLVLSRNLTHDNSWDVLVRLDSVGRTRTPISENAGLSSFLGSLPVLAPKLPQWRREAVLKLASEIRRVEWELPEGVDVVRFHHLESGSDIDWRGKECCIISPYVDAGGITAVAGDVPTTLISRPDQLELLPPEVLQNLTATMVLDPAAGAPPTDEDGDADGDPLDETSDVNARGLSAELHAKVYVIESYGRRQRARLLIGSANATDAALSRNVEVMVEMEGPRKRLGIDALIGSDTSLVRMLVDYSATGGATKSDREELEGEIEYVLRTIAAIEHQVSVSPDTGGVWSVNLSADKPYPVREDWTIWAGPLTLPGKSQQIVPGEKLDITIAGLETADLSAFISIQIEAPGGVSASTVVVAELVGAPADRLDQVIARQINTPEKLGRLIRLLLEFSNPHALESFVQGGETQPGSHSGWGATGEGYLELILQALAEHPKSIDDLDQVITRLARTEAGRSVIPDGFEAFWRSVVKAKRLVTA